MTGPPAGCHPWFWSAFHECLRTSRDYVGFSVAMASILLWMVAQFPQYYQNYKTKTVEALSPWFLAQWLLGDTGNILGCLLTGDQQPTTTYTAMYFVIADIVLMMQFMYYGSLARRRERIFTYAKRHRRRRQYSNDETVLQVTDGVGHSADRQHRTHHRHRREPEQVHGGTETGPGHSSFASVSAKAAGALAGVAAVGLVAISMPSVVTRAAPLAAAAGRMLGEQVAVRPQWMKSAGQVCGYVSSVLYLSSRLPQIYLNYQRKSVEGLALAMFMCAVSANLAYGGGILIRATSWAAVMRQAPWIIGSLGTVTLDCVILCQFGRYSKVASAAPVAANQEPLLRTV